MTKTINLTPTEYLFGHPKERYHGVLFPELGHMRIYDAKEVLEKLQDRVEHYPYQQNKFQDWLRIRIPKVQDAISTWQKILEIEEG